MNNNIQCDHIIGQMSMTYETVILITMNELISYQKETIFSLNDFLDRRKSTNLTHFNYCPICGTKINWPKLKKNIK